MIYWNHELIERNGGKRKKICPISIAIEHSLELSIPSDQRSGPGIFDHNGGATMDEARSR